MKKATREEILVAISLVLGAQYKKDAPEAFKVLERSGYYIYKRSTHIYAIRNTTTGRELYAEGRHRYRRLYYSGYGYRKSMLWEDTGHFDFVGYLDKPQNKEWYELQNKGGWCSGGWYETPTQKKVKELTRAKSYVVSQDREIERCKQDINNLLARLENLGETKAKYIQNVNIIRESMGLRKR